LAKQLSAATSDAEVVRVVRNNQLTSGDPEIRAVLAQHLAADEAAETLKSIIELRSGIEDTPPASTSVTAVAKEIKSSPVYRDPGVNETSNWLSRALDRLRNLKFNTNRKKPNFGLPELSIGPWFSMVMWGVIAATILGLLYLAARHIRWQRRVARRATAVLEDDEPERSLDEWLAEADTLQAQGRYREAVRALYLASLLRFDEARVARFQRGQTNWEHLTRIEASPTMPKDLDFRATTRLFDRIWYGRIVRGKEDVDQFRAWYLNITNTLRAAGSLK
jgi:hypothetical protein